MLRKSSIDDIRLADEIGKGDPIRFTNQEFRKMFDLADLRKEDIFYDLGSGWGQSLIIALTEYNVRKTVGIEKDRERHEVSILRLKKRKLLDRAQVVLGNFEDLYSDKLQGASLREPTVVFYGLTSDEELIKVMRQSARAGCRLIYYFNGLFPEIKAERTDFPFFVSTVPFKKPLSEYDWLSSVVPKKKSSLAKGERPGPQELWDELTHDYDVYSGDTSDIRYYKRKLEQVLTESNART